MKEIEPIYISHVKVLVSKSSTANKRCTEHKRIHCLGEMEIRFLFSSPAMGLYNTHTFLINYQVVDRRNDSTF